MKRLSLLLRVAPFVLCWPALIVPASADETHRIFAQKLVDDAKATRPDLLTIGIHAKPPNSSEYVIIAHTNRKSVGHKSEGADLVTLRTGEPDGPNALPGGIYDVGVALHDRSGKAVGFLAMHIKPSANSNDPKAESLQSAMTLRDELAKQIASEAALFKTAD
jgi:hypothetical protein